MITGFRYSWIQGCKPCFQDLIQVQFLFHVIKFHILGAGFALRHLVLSDGKLASQLWPHTLPGSRKAEKKDCFFLVIHN